MNSSPVQTTRLRGMREERGMSQDYMADQLGVSRPTYILIEKGEKELTVSQMAKLIELFGMEVTGKHAKKIGPHHPTFVPKLDIPKFKEILLYILEKVGAKPNIGETALYKILYFIDFDYFEKFGKSLTGATYIKNHHGPTPTHFKKVADKMIDDGELVPVQSKYFRFDQKKYLPHRTANLDSFTAQEMKHIDEVLARLSDRNGSELSFYSHQDTPWMATEDREIIDYNLVFQRMAPYAQHDHEGAMLQASADDILRELGPMSDEEYRYYESL